MGGGGGGICVEPSSSEILNVSRSVLLKTFWSDSFDCLTTVDCFNPPSPPAHKTVIVYIFVFPFPGMRSLSLIQGESTEEAVADSLDRKVVLDKVDILCNSIIPALCCQLVLIKIRKVYW